MAEIEFDHVTKRYADGFEAVKHLNLAEAARILDLEQHLGRKPANLSGGQRQRVAMGRAIVRNSLVFLMDEPLSNLDAKLRAQMRTEISRIQQRLETTTIYVTHDQTEAMTWGVARIAVIRAGVLQQVGPPSELWLETEYRPVVAMLRDAGLVEGRTDAEAYMNIAAERYWLFRTHERNEDVLRQVLEGRGRRRRLRG